MKLTDMLTLGVTRVRKHHALEHATLQILSGRKPQVSSGGYSDPQGFWIIGNFSAEEILLAAQEAVTRLQNGERGLAVHPHCGTNFVASGLAAGSAAWLAMLPPASSLRRRVDRWPLVVSLVTVALMLSAPLGPWLQMKVTTDSKIGKLKIAQVIRYPRNGLVLHRIKTEG